MEYVGWLYHITSQTIAKMFRTGYSNVSIMAETVEGLITKDPVLREWLERTIESLKLDIVPKCCDENCQII